MDSNKVTVTTDVSSAYWPGTDVLCVKLDNKKLFPDMYLITQDEGIQCLKRYSYWLRDKYQCEY